jgi:hypothetical protein
MHAMNSEKCHWCQRYLRAVELKSITGCTTGKRQVLSEIGKSINETIQTIKKVHREERLDSSAVFKWHKRFIHERDSLEYVECSGLRITATTNFNICETALSVSDNCFRTLYDVAAAAVSHGTFLRILFDDLNISRIT